MLLWNPVDSLEELFFKFNFNFSKNVIDFSLASPELNTSASIKAKYIDTFEGSYLNV